MNKKLGLLGSSIGRAEQATSRMYSSHSTTPLHHHERIRARSFARLVSIDLVGQLAPATVVAVKVLRHEDSSTTLLRGALLPEPADLAGLIDLVVLEHMKLHLGVLVLDLLGLGVGLLLPLLTHGCLSSFLLWKVQAMT